MKTVYVGLSGGVDSSVTAALVKAAGYHTVGVYMKNWTTDLPGIKCPWKEDLADARAVSAALDIELKVFDFEAQYRGKVVQYLIDEYQDGRTPNPDIMCNQEIKFKLFLETALADGADLIATGHYAATRDGKLLVAADAAKDQTYFLYRITHEALEKTIFPLGELTKPEVRVKAEELGLVTAKKPDSQGICFVGEVGMKAFLKQYVTTVPGDVIVKASSKLVGQHEGAVFYTIGQRHGLGIGGGKPYYVIGKDMTTNVVYVTDDENDLSLRTDEFGIEDVHWITRAPEVGESVQVRIRHRGDLVPTTVEINGDQAIVKMSSAQRAVSPGQSAVIYSGSEVLGGGIISS